MRKCSDDLLLIWANRHRSMKCYLSGIRFAQINLGLGDPFRNKAMPRLEYILTGIKQVQARAGTPPKPRLPITPALLECLRVVWLSSPANPDHIMLWPAACTEQYRLARHSGGRRWRHRVGPMHVIFCRS